MADTQKVWGMFSQQKMIEFKRKAKEGFDDFLGEVVRVLRNAYTDTSRPHCDVRDVINDHEVKMIKHLSLKHGSKLEKLAAAALRGEGYLKRVRGEKDAYVITEKGKEKYDLNFRESDGKLAPPETAEAVRLVLGLDK
ncbi:MAG: hypothetical protein M1334_04915 [Patescibacteria group bacterium]|nr:hypothetical protein [Patescibacteria group bacterium]